MNLFGFHISRDLPAPAKKSFTPEQWLRGEDLDSRTSTLSNAYQQVVWVYRAINVLAEQVANTPFLFSAGDRGRETLITTGPLLDFYSRPHPGMNRFQYWELRVIWLMLRGECFRVPIYSDSPNLNHNHNLDLNPSLSAGGERRGEVARAFSSRSLSASGGEGRGEVAPFSSVPSHSLSASGGEGRGEVAPSLRTPHSRLRTLKSIVFLDPSHCHHIIEDHKLVGWRYTGFGPNAPLESQVFLPEEVWFEKLPNPFDTWRGMPPLYVAETPAKTDFAASAFMRGIIENNADAGLIVRSDQQLDDDQRAQVIATITNRKRRAGAADRPILLWGVNEIVRPTLSSADLQFLENRKFSRTEICAVFGVPEEIITTTERAKYDVMAGARLNFIESRVAPLCSRLEAEEDVTVKSIDPSAVGWFDLDSLPIMQEARRARLAAVKTGFDMGIPFNELNRVFDLGFKSLPWGNTGYLKSNLNPIGALPRPSDGRGIKGEGS